MVDHALTGLAITVQMRLCDEEGCDLGPDGEPEGGLIVCFLLWTSTSV